MRILLLLLLAAAPAAADIRLPAVIAENMVLQRGAAVPIWGWADPGEKISVALGEQRLTATADESGRWLVKLAALEPTATPLTMRIAGDRSAGERVLRNILVGEVWVCSGQSNMAWPVVATYGGPQAIAEAQRPAIRLFHVTRAFAGQPQRNLKGAWLPCSPETVKRFSAVAYYYGLALRKRLQVPIGLIGTSWGGTRIEPWTPRAGFDAVPRLRKLAQRVSQAEAHYQREVVRRLDRIADWVESARTALAAGKAAPTPPTLPRHQLASHGAPTGLYNAMVHPLVPYGIRGAIWYQGESNLKDGMAYFEKMKGLIGGWRKVWGQGNFPFYYVQLAPFSYGGSPEQLPRIWEAQDAALALPATGMAVTTDVGNLRDIHPRNKRAVGDRLARWALSQTYGHEDVAFSGPRYKGMTVENGSVRLTFTHLAGGLESRDGKPLNWFYVAGEDRKFHLAQATIDKGSVIVASPKVPAPVAVRFGWHQQAQPNLRNKAGLPAAPFRTDRW